MSFTEPGPDGNSTTSTSPSFGNALWTRSATSAATVELGRSEEHTSELQSLPTRRSSDLNVLHRARPRWELDDINEPVLRECLVDSVCDLGGHGRVREIGRAHV